MHARRALQILVLAIAVVRISDLAAADAVHQAPAIACAAEATERVSMRSTSRLPEASGTVTVECVGGTTNLGVELDSMKPASLFGGDYNTYVLWVVPPGGPAENVGEIFLHGSHGNLRATTKAATFALLVTAEPHYLASAPSAFVLMQNDADLPGQLIAQPLIQGIYNFSRSTLENVKDAKGEVRTDVKQAFTAVRLAQRAGAATFAPEELAQAQQALKATIGLWRERKDRMEIAAQARDTVRLAVAAQRLAQARALDESRVTTEGSGGGNDETKRARSARHLMIGGKGL